MLGIYNGRISTLQAAFEEERDLLYTKARCDVEEMLQSAGSEQDHLHAIIFRMHQTSEESRGRVVALHNVRVDELRNHVSFLPLKKTS